MTSRRRQESRERLAAAHLQLGGFVSTIVAALVLAVVAGIVDLLVGRAFLTRSAKAAQH